MFEYEFIEKLFRELEMFINDYVRFFEMMNEHSHGNILSIRLSEEEFYFPCTWTEFAHRAKQLHDRLQTPMRSLAQTRRKEISRGIDVRHQYSTNNQRIRFQSEFKVRLEQMHNIGNLSRIRMIIDALELYDEIRIQPSSLNITFRLLPIVQYIQQQLCCISNYLQKILDQHTLIIERHLRKLHEKLRAYEDEMQRKLSAFHSRDIRPPVLIIPCPCNGPSLLSSSSR